MREEGTKPQTLNPKPQTLKKPEPYTYTLNTKPQPPNAEPRVQRLGRSFDCYLNPESTLAGPALQKTAEDARAAANKPEPCT